ncbi:MAG: HIG1 domain-containing protein [Sphingomonadales bacterium]|nr:HIG1 domain-containing protein [Sphingomonadales bacterium]MDE2168991.1 HIG1 domain-containing protein [Sphingomonadales bacterium]
MAKWMLVPIIVVLMGYVVVSLVRGVVTFLRASREEIDNPGEGPSPNQLRQNQLMFARVKYQGLAVLVVIILLAASR